MAEKGEKHEELEFWPCDRCTFLNKPEDKECAVCEPMTVVMKDNLKHSPTPDYYKIMEEYPSDDEDGSSEGEGDEAKKDEPQPQEETAENEKKEKEETNTAGPSNWKKKKNQQKERKQAKKPRVESSDSSSSDEFINTTLAKQFKEKCESSSDDSE